MFIHIIVTPPEVVVNELLKDSNLTCKEKCKYRKYIPVLKTWEKIEYKNVQKKINGIIKKLNNI
jgi:hypothetical protein